MGRLANISGKQAVTAFGRAGWQSIGQVSSHLVMVKPGVNANLSVPQHRELSVGTLRSLIKYSGLTEDEFLKLLKKECYVLGTSFCAVMHLYWNSRLFFRISPFHYCILF